jgi:RNA polymerase sigma factor (sigma-70 family)
MAFEDQSKSGQISEAPSAACSSVSVSQASVFRTTRWNLVRRAQEGEGDVARDGLERLGRIYWYPLYAYARRQSLKEEDAKDLTQAFLARLLTEGGLQSVDPSKGRFRSFLLACFKNFLSDARDSAKAVKRGGGVEFISLNSEAAAERYESESAPLSGEEHYDRDWAQSLMSEALERLRGESRQSGKEERFEALQPFLMEEMSTGEEKDLRKKLALGESGLRSALQRLRFRLGEYLWTEVARTVRDTADVEGEMRHLMDILSKVHSPAR